MDFLLPFYLYIKAFHVIAFVSWMAGMLYLPRLYVYHADTEKGSAQSETFKVMERRLLRYIMNPAMIATFLFGILLISANPALLSDGWLHAKILLVLIMAGTHGMLSKCRRNFEADANIRPAKFYRIINEVPTVLMIVIVILAVAKPF